MLDLLTLTGESQSQEQHQFPESNFLKEPVALSTDSLRPWQRCPPFTISDLYLGFWKCAWSASMKARDRMAMQRWERLNKERKAWLEAGSHLLEASE